MNIFQSLYDKQKANFDSDITKTYEWRVDQLDRLEKMIREHETEFQQAMARDFKTAYAEQYFETQAPLATIAYTKSQLKSWMAPAPAPIPRLLAETNHRGEVLSEPFGVTLVIGPFTPDKVLALNDWFIF